MKRFQINIVGESGSGLMSVGEIVIAAFHRMGFFVFADREFPSLIKGGYSCFSIVVSDVPVSSYDYQCEVMVAFDKQGMECFADRIIDGGILVHGYERLEGVANLIFELIKDNNVRVVQMNARSLAKQAGGSILMSNIVVLGGLWKVLGLDYESVLKAIEKEFASKPVLLEIDKIAMKIGFDAVKQEPDYVEWINSIYHSPVVDDLHTIMDGNKSISLGAVLAGCRAYFAYPMSPASSILTYLSEWVSSTGMMVKQAEDEITAAQLNIGASYAGTRALTATSGGGFDLMTESLSLAAMIEVPFVLINVQRPGPATGLPTWTAQADLDLMRFAGHGEYTRLVMSVSGADDAVYLIQDAFNYAEKYQIPVLVLSEKLIAESMQTVRNDLFEQIPVERNLCDGEEDLVSEMRYAYTANGVSKRWIPASNDVSYFANGDEHYVDGSLTEEALESSEMIAKRIRKERFLLEELPEPVLYGNLEPEVVVVGFGGTRLVMLDILRKYSKVGYLHYTYLWPLRIEVLKDLKSRNCRIVLLEGNAKGQLGSMLESEFGKELFADRFLKFDGRPFYFLEVCEFIESNLKKHE